MSTTSNLALQIARRQKRLVYWREQFESHSPSDRMGESDRHRLQERLDTYRLLLTRLAAAHSSKNEADFAETDGRLSTLDRELATMFESRRLLTSTLGSAAIAPGEGVAE